MIMEQCMGNVDKYTMYYTELFSFEDKSLVLQHDFKDKSVKVPKSIIVVYF